MVCLKKENPYDNDASATSVCPEEQPECVQDCSGLWGGTAYLDDCEICVGGRTGLVPCRCGDGIVHPERDEECDTGGVSESCDADCTLSRCGDGVVNPLAGELCDDGNAIETDSCVSGDNAPCVWAACGDGIVQPGQGEVCDDGNTATESCSYGEEVCVVCDGGCQERTLSGSFCGDGVVQAQEVCDDGNRVDGDYCSADCGQRTSVCGDGVRELSEVCDDGNQDDGDYCSADCFNVTTICGDWRLEGTEACDDGNTFTETCQYGQLECVICDSSCALAFGEVSYCGDGITQDGESCDDGNVGVESCAYGLESCLVCDAGCELVPGNVAYCGDGIVQADEACDAGTSVVDTCRYGVSSCLLCDANCNEFWGRRNIAVMASSMAPSNATMAIASPNTAPTTAMAAMCAIRRAVMFRAHFPIAAMVVSAMASSATMETRRLTITARLIAFK